MASALTFTFRRVKRTGALDARVREVAERLRRCDERITHCHISVVAGADGRPDDPSIAVRIHVSVPGAQVHAESIQADGARHSDVFLALRDAYDSALRQLRDLQRDGRKSSLLSAVRGSTAP